MIAMVSVVFLALPACNDTQDSDSDNDAARTGPRNANPAEEPNATDATSTDETPGEAQESIPAAWADAKVGDRVKLRIHGGPQPRDVFRTTTVKEVSRESVVLEHQVVVDMPSMPGMGQLPSVPAGSKTLDEVDRNAKPWQQSAQGAPDVPASPVKTGSESMTIDGKTVQATVYQADVPGMGQVKYWLSSDVPGHLVKMTAGNGMTMEVVEFQKN
jgi:hypothetical protein